MTQQIRVGTAPDSWGVWFPSEPHQVPLALILFMESSKYGSSSHLEIALTKFIF